MKVIIVNKHGNEWTFASVKEATPFVRKSKRDEYEIQKRGDEKVRVYDDRN